ncbi:MAG: Na/Pi cotransporter family protein [Acholeplasmatales bacterium]
MTDVMMYVNAVLMMLGGVGALLIGMAMLSNNMRKVASTKLEELFNKTTNNRYMGFGIGLGTTAIIQSSSVTTVMVVGLVNAGVLTLFQATTIIMGANVGTTVTAQLASLAALKNSGFDFVIVAMLFAFVGSFMTMLAKKERVKVMGNVLSGLGLVFVALYLLGVAMESIKGLGHVEELLTSLSNPFVLLLIGTIITAIFQSSSAITAIIISMSIAGIAIGNGGNDALYVILGTNIGTTVTAALSAIGTNTNARRTALIHLLFNVFGSVIFFIILLIFPGFKENFLGSLFRTEANQIAMFHTIFNLSCSILFLPFAEVFVSISKKLIPDKEQKNRQVVVLDERLLKTPSIAVKQLKKETVIMAENAMSGLRDSFNAFVKKDVTIKETIQAQIRNTNRINKQITAYLVKLSGENLNYQDKVEVSALYHVINDLERIGDLADNLTKYTDALVYEKLHFTDTAIEDLKEMFGVIEELFVVSLEVFTNPTQEKIDLVDVLEQKVDDLRKSIVDSHIVRLEEGICSPDSSPVLINLVSNLERAADHMQFIAHSKY